MHGPSVLEMDIDQAQADAATGSDDQDRWHIGTVSPFRLRRLRPLRGETSDPTFGFGGVPDRPLLGRWPGEPFDRCC
jgi:hypothetical protein